MLGRTHETAAAAGTDMGNRSMRKAGRKAWNADDFEAASRTYHLLMPCPMDVDCIYCNPEAVCPISR